MTQFHPGFSTKYWLLTLILSGPDYVNYLTALEKPEKKTEFKDLPAELRIKIWSLVDCPGRVIKVFTSHSLPITFKCDDNIAIRRVCFESRSVSGLTPTDLFPHASGPFNIRSSPNVVCKYQNTSCHRSVWIFSTAQPKKWPRISETILTDHLLICLSSQGSKVSALIRQRTPFSWLVVGASMTLQSACRPLYRSSTAWR